MIRQTLRNLPVGLFETYSRKLAKIVTRRKLNLVRRIFSWVAVAVHPLLLEELQEAVAFDSEDSFWNPEKLPHPSVIMGSCENLVILDEDGKVCFAHHTVRSFLESLDSSTEYSEFCLDIVTANILAATFCLSYLSFSDFEAQLVRREQQIITHVQTTTGLSTGGLRFVTGALGLSDGWFTLPYRLLGGKPYQSPPPVELKWKTMRRKPGAAQSLGVKYRMLDYAMGNWLLHTKDLQTEDVDETTVYRFRNLALERVMVFDHTKWAAASSPEDLPFDPVCRWATENNHLPILRLLQSPPWGPSVHHYWWIQQRSGEDPLRGPCLKGHSRVLDFMLQATDTTCHEAEKNMQMFLTRDHLVWCASANGHHDVVETILATGVSPNTTSQRPDYVSDELNPKKASALEIAVRKGHAEVARRLIKHGANVNIPDDHLEIPLHYANSDTIAVLLLQGGADIDSRSRHDQSPLHSAAIAGRDVVVYKLLTAGACVNAEDDSGKTPLHHAKSDTIATLLLQGGADIEYRSTNGERPLHSAVGDRRDVVVAKLLAAGACVYAKSFSGRTPLHYASDPVTAARLLKFDPSNIHAIDSNKETPLLLAASRGHAALVALFCNSGASTNSVNASGETALHLAVKWSHPETVRELLVCGPMQIHARDQVGITPLDYAMRKGPHNFVSLFLEHGVDIAEFWKFAFRPCDGNLYAAVINRLFELNFPVDFEDHDGMSALHYAAEMGNVSAVYLLIEKHANIDKISHNGCTPLMCGVLKGQIATSRALLEARASVNLQDSHGRTALFIAASLGDMKIVYLLKEYGADPRIAGRALEDEGNADAILKTPSQVLKLPLWANAATHWDLVGYLGAKTGTKFIF